MRIPDEVIDYVAEKYFALGLNKTSITFIQYLETWAKINYYGEVI